MKYKPTVKKPDELELTNWAEGIGYTLTMVVFVVVIFALAFV